MGDRRRSIGLTRRDLRGSRLRCLILTALPAEDVALYLTQLLEPHGHVDPRTDRWMPRGFLKPEEARLGDSETFLTADSREGVTTWWLAARERANTPNWDIVSTAEMEGRRGLLLVEAKAHARELKEDDRCGARRNLDTIRAAVAEADTALNEQIPGWSLTTDSHFQLCNRFAWAWKIGSLGIPVTLAYLGFLRAEDMLDQGNVFESASSWQRAMTEYSEGIVPPAAWNRAIETGGAPMRAVVRSVDFRAEISTARASTPPAPRPTSGS